MTRLQQYIANHPDTPLFNDGYPIDPNNKKYCLCARKVGYCEECIMGDGNDCRDCWNAQK